MSRAGRRAWENIPGQVADRQVLQVRREVRSREGFKQGCGPLQLHFRELALADVASRPGTSTPFFPLRGSCVRLLGPLRQSTTSRVAQTTEMYDLTVRRPEAQDQGVGRAMLSRKAPGKALSHGILPVRVHSSLYKGVSHAGLGFTLLQYDFISISYICMTLFPNKFTF